MFQLIKATIDYKRDYYGVTGKYFNEILDDHPIVSETIIREKICYRISGERRLSGPKQRMILKSHMDSDLIILKGNTKIQIGEAEVICMVIKNEANPDISSLMEIVFLASFRWPHKNVYVNSTRLSPKIFDALVASGWKPIVRDGNTYATNRLLSPYD